MEYEHTGVTGQKYFTTVPVKDMNPANEPAKPKKEKIKLKNMVFHISCAACGRKMELKLRSTQHNCGRLESISAQVEPCKCVI